MSFLSFRFQNSVIRLVLLTLTMTLGMQAGACYSGLVVIPTADVIGNKQFTIEPQIDGTTSKFQTDTYLLNTEFGLSDQFEIGVDFDLSEESDQRLLLNAKYALGPFGKTPWRFAFGITNTGANVDTNPYIVATGELEHFRLHFGVIHIESNERWFVGADKEVGNALTVMADYTSGNDNYSSIGLSYEFNSSLCLFTGVMFPNSEGDTRFTLHLVYTGSLGGSTKEKK